ncbi:MAG: CBS domain-containing protein [Acidobacteriota bacterium]
MKASELMTGSPETCEPGDSLRDAVKIMKEADCGIVPVTEGNGEARVVGVITDRDIALHLGESDRKASDVRIGDVMSTEIVACEPSASVEEVARRMQEAQVRRVLVVENGRLRGVIATADLARASSASTKDRLGNEVERVIERVSEPGPAR